MRRDRGFALLIVLWSVVLLTLLATGITAAGRTDVQLASNLRGAATAEAAADGAIHAAVFHLLDPASPWAADGSSRVVEGPSARVTVRIENEGGKVNPNIAQPELLRALLQQAGADAQTAQTIAEGIVEWRFPSDVQRVSGGQAARYRNAGLPYGPPGAPFESLQELGAVIGMTPAILDRVLPYLSVVTDAAPDLRAASPVVLRAMQQATGAPVSSPGAGLPLRFVTIVAAAETKDGSRFVRRASVRLGGTPKEALMQVLTWDAEHD